MLGGFLPPMTYTHTEANEVPLHIHRIKLTLQYSTKLMASEENSAYSCVYESSYTALYGAKERANL